MSHKAVEWNRLHWDLKRITIHDLTRLTVAFQKQHPQLAVDGRLGPNTLAVLRGEEKASQDFRGPLDWFPRTLPEVVATFGNPRVSYTRIKGKVIVDKGWEREHMILTRHLPCGIKKLYVHRKAEPYLRETLARIEAHEKSFTIRSIGCFNPRHQRYDARLPLSDHTWGIAVDINPIDNQPVSRAVEPFSDVWNRQWAGSGAVPEWVVQIFEDVGWSWGGRWKTFCDPMHFSLRQV